MDETPLAEGTLWLVLGQIAVEESRTVEGSAVGGSAVGGTADTDS